MGSRAQIPEKQHQDQKLGDIPHLSYSVFSELVLPFLYQFLTDQDQRPTFILSNNTNNSNNGTDAPSLLYANKAFCNLQRTCTTDIARRCADLTRPPARPNSVTNLQNDLLVHFHPIQTASLTGWFCFAEQTQKQPEGIDGSNYVEDDPGTELVYNSKGLVRLDWTRGWCPMATNDPDYYRFLREFDWASTPLGPYTHWSKSLRCIVNAIMPLKHPVIIWYGKEGLCIYNSAFKDIGARGRHPALTGAPLHTGWPDIADQLLPLLERAMEGTTSAEKEARFLFNRWLEPEETYFTYQVSPLIDDNGSFMGALASTHEVTGTVVSARRKEVTQTLVSRATKFKDLSPEGGFWDGVLEALDLNPLDSPFALIYRVEAWQACRLLGGRGLPDNSIHPFTQYFDLDVSPTLDAFFQYQFKELSTDQKEYILVEFTTQQLEQLKSMPYRGYGSCKAAVVIPFYHGYIPPVKGFLVLGLNDRRMFDQSYQMWVEELARTLWKTMDTVWAKQEEARIQHEHSVSIKLKTEEIVLALQRTTQELKESELLFARTADLIPIGLACLDAVGSIIYANDAWHELCFLPKGEPRNTWPRLIYNPDRDKVVSAFTKAFANKTTMSIEFRMGNDDTPGSKGWRRWCRASATPNFGDGTGQLTGYVGTIVDITDAKDAAEYQRQLTVEAVERKRQQENFIDVTCHELRNPLTAILQSADEITQLVKGLASGTGAPESTLIHNIDQAASTISACGEHQRKIVDDILNLSKMDAGLLTIEPVPTQPQVVLQKVMKMFDPDFKAKGISSSFNLREGYSKHCEGRWWALDPARLTQITMNLVTNAVKFTATKAGVRKVRVSLDASNEPPDFKDNFQSSTTEDEAAQSSHPPISRPPPIRPIAQRSTSVVKMSPLNVVYLLVCVEDTGIGISHEWRAVMGQRYRQAPKTHISYGGSGLGLFIARQLAFLLGGELHFDSEVGVGSTFSFYVRCEQCAPPDYNGDPLLYPTSSHSPSSTSTPSLPPPKRGEGMRVLVVEDNIINQKILKRQLEGQGCQVEVASHGVEALEVITAKEQSPFTVVLMDMEMPVMDGVTATERIRATEQAMTSGMRHLPIIGTSANARTEHIHQMLLAGMDDVITKPFVIGDLMSKIDSVLQVFQVSNVGQGFPRRPP